MSKNNNQAEFDKVFHVKQTAEYFGKCSDTIRRWVKIGLLKSYKDSLGYNVFKIKELESFKKKNKHLFKG